MFGNLGEMAKLMQRAKDIQKNMGKVKEELARAEYSGSSSNHLVTAVVTGDFNLKSILIAPEAMNDRELLEDLVTAAVNNAINGARQAAQQKMTELTGGINIPGLS